MLAAPVAAALSLLGVAVPAQATSGEYAEAVPVAPAAAAANGDFLVAIEQCGPWGCDYATYWSLTNPTGCHVIPSDPKEPTLTGWREFSNETDGDAYLYNNTDCSGGPDAILEPKSDIKIASPTYRSVLFR
ncbi:hypothetical protein [Kitasatospora sp. NPDC057541]|uniref:hypothetical protein n=1 Tax=unclassified Kitasatospora TaxID=2633591 RepID=UPI00369B489F